MFSTPTLVSEHTTDPYIMLERIICQAQKDFLSRNSPNNMVQSSVNYNELDYFFSFINLFILLELSE